MPTLMPKDADNVTIPALRLRPGGSHSISVTSGSARNAVAFSADTRIVGLYATGPVFIRFGGSSVTASASDHYLPAGVYYDFAIGGGRVEHNTHVAVIRADINCTLYVSEKE